jgi:hypothetical protein
VRAVERFAGSNRRVWQQALETCARECQVLDSSEPRFSRTTPPTTRR